MVAARIGTMIEKNAVKNESLACFWADLVYSRAVKEHGINRLLAFQRSKIAKSPLPLTLSQIAISY